MRTELLDLPDADLLDVLPRDSPVAWLRRGEGMVGWGVAAEVRTSGSTRFADANKWWTETTSRAEVRDAVGEPGTGLVCFGTFAFADEPGESVLVVPEIVVGRRAGVTWLTTIGRTSVATPAVVTTEPPAPPEDVAFADGALDG